MSYDHDFEIRKAALDGALSNASGADGVYLGSMIFAELQRRGLLQETGQADLGVEPRYRGRPVTETEALGEMEFIVAG